MYMIKYLKNALFIAIILFSAPLLYAQNPPLEGSWEVVPEFTDEFNSGGLDPSKWNNTDPQWPGRHPSYFEPNNVSLSGGELLLKSQMISRQDHLARKMKKGGYTHAGAAIKSKTKVKYGYFEARVKPSNSNYWNSFWFYEYTPENWSEIAPFEIVGSENYLLRTAHLFRSPSYKGTIDNHIKAQEQIFYPESFNVNDYHVYGLDWNKERVTWYIDGEEVFSAANEHWHRALNMIFDAEVNPKWPAIPDSNSSPATFKIDYIRTWKRKSDSTKGS